MCVLVIEVTGFSPGSRSVDPGGDVGSRTTIISLTKRMECKGFL